MCTGPAQYPDGISRLNAPTVPKAGHRDLLHLTGEETGSEREGRKARQKAEGLEGLPRFFPKDKAEAWQGTGTC